MAEITINGKRYPVKFGISTIKTFSLKHGFNTVNEFDRWIQKADYTAFETMEMFADLFLTAIKRGCSKKQIEVDIDIDDFLDFMMENIDEFQKLQAELGKSINEYPEKKSGEKEKKPKS